MGNSALRLEDCLVPTMSQPTVPVPWYEPNPKSYYIHVWTSDRSPEEVRSSAQTIVDPLLAT